jgi:mono/diheme cytochrome c family protein
MDQMKITSPLVEARIRLAAVPAIAMVLIGGMSNDTVSATVHHVSEGSTPPQTAIRQGDVGRGRASFNGNGICFFCHGKDGDINQVPSLSRETTDIISRLDPKPSDLRNSRTLKLRTDIERFTAMRGGHSGTAMLPDKKLTDEDIADLLAYLSLLRAE